MDGLVRVGGACRERLRSAPVPGLCLLAASVASGWLGAGAARADVTATTTFTSSGSYTFTVPTGVTSIEVTAIGAAGASCGLSRGGEGGSIAATLAVQSGQQLFVGVGSPGSCSRSGGAGGGGAGGTPGPDGHGAGGGGGGASLVGVGSPSPAFGGLQVVAGGGGGVGFSMSVGRADGGDADRGGSPLGPGGGPGSGTAGGTGGSSDGQSGDSPGVAGAFGGGGDGGNSSATLGNGGGGGGGGYYGGGGGGAGVSVSGGGGGGSSFVATGAANVSGPTPTTASAGVMITYAAPTADVNAASLTFPQTPQGIASSEQDLTVTNNGSAPLLVAGVLVSGPDPGDYLIDNHCQQPVAAGSSCQIGVRFAPQAEGASSATLTLLTNAATPPAEVTLSGTGGSLPQGPPGPTGASAAGGATGATGPGGPAGASGAQGPPGEIELVTCKTVLKKVKGHRRNVQTCTGRLVAGTVRFNATGALVHATISRGGVIYATGASVTANSDSSELVLADRRALHPGSYTLSLRSRHGRRWTTRRRGITIG